MGGAEVGAEGSKAERGVACAHRWMGIMTARRWQRGYLWEKGAEGFGVRDGIGRFQENERPLVGFFLSHKHLLNEYFWSKHRLKRQNTSYIMK
jgi:hypothetical protein